MTLPTPDHGRRRAIVIPDDLWAALEREAAAEDRSVSSLIRNHLRRVVPGAESPLVSQIRQFLVGWNADGPCVPPSPAVLAVCLGVSEAEIVAALADLERTT